MTTINVKEETKEDFKKERLNYSAKVNENISEDEFVKTLLNKFKEKKK